MPLIDNFVAFQVLDATSNVSVQGFSLAGIVNKNTVQDANTRYMEFSSPDGVLDAGFLDTDYFYTTAVVMFSQKQRPSKIVSIWQDALEDVDDALSALSAEELRRVYYLGMEEVTNAAILLIAAYTAPRYKAVAVQSSSAAFLAGTVGNIGLQLKALGYEHVHLQWHADDDEPLAAATLARVSASNPDAPNGAITWNAMELIGVTPDEISDTQLTNIQTGNGNVFVEAGGLNVTLGGFASNGEFIDLKTTRDWAHFRGQEAYFRVITSTPTKLPLTQEGIGVFENEMRALVSLGVRNGHWSGDAPIRIVAPDISEVSTADRIARNLNPPIKAYPTYANAIHHANGQIEVIVGP